MELMAYVAILLYCIFEIYMISFYGNELMVTTNRLGYHLFQSDWIDRFRSIRMNVLIFGELLMKPTEIMVLNLYPLTPKTFTNVRLFFVSFLPYLYMKKCFTLLQILNSAYSMFNVLQNFK